MAELAGRNAPGRLEVVRAFVNTRDREAGTDALSGSAELAEHLVAWQLLTPGARLGASDLASALELREALRTLLRAHNGQPVDTAPAVDTVNRLTALAGVRPAMAYGGSVGYHVVRSGGIGALGAIVAIVYAAEAQGVWSRVKACASDTCHWAYYDASRNRASRWCHMQLCGNRAKGQAFRARRATGAAPDRDDLAVE